MKQRKKILSISGVLTYGIGILIGLALCGWYAWGEAEASLLVFRTGEAWITTLRCPLMIASTEAGSVTAFFDNPTVEVIHPTVRAEISHPDLARTESTILTLAPGETKQLQWTVGQDDMIFGGLVLVNVFETSQLNFPSHQSSCGILVSKLPGLAGKWVFLSIFLISLFGMAAGVTLWEIGNSPLRGLIQEATNAGFALASVIVLGMLFSFPHWWVLSGFCFLVAIMVIVIMITQFVLFPVETKHGKT